MKCHVFEIAYWLDVDMWVFVRYGAEALQEVFKSSTNSVDNMITECHMITLAFVEALVVEGLLLFAVVISSCYSIRDGPDDIPIAAVFHPRVKANLNVFDLWPVGCIGGEERAVWCVVVDFELRQARGAVALDAVDEAAYTLVHFPLIPGAAAGHWQGRVWLGGHTY